MTTKEFNQSVDLFSDHIYRFILKNIHDSEKARDIVQDTFEKLWVRHKDVEAEKTKSYLFTTAYHTMIDIIRREKKFDHSSKIRYNSMVHDRHYSDLSEVLHKAVEQLPTDQRSVIMLRDYEGYSYEEISEITGLNLSQVKVYIFRGRLFLKNYIGSMEAVI